MKLNNFKIISDKKPAGDQPKAIKKILDNLKKNVKDQTLLGVTGSGKTFTIAGVIEKYKKPTLVLAHNKTLAAQLTQELKDFFPNNSIHYFVSYYDYYQPEAYIPTSDTYIAKEAQINKEIDRLRHASTQSLITRNDTIIVASVSAIYGLGSREEYEKSHILIKKGDKKTKEEILKSAIKLFFERTKGELDVGKISVISNYIEIVGVNEEIIYKIEFSKDRIKNIKEINLLTREVINEDVKHFFLFPAKHFITDDSKRKKSIENIQKEAREQESKFKKQGKLIEAERIRRRTLEDISLIKEVGYCNGIENYSRHFDFRKEGEAPNTLLSFFPKDKNGNPDFLTVIDESHVTIPQIRAMFAGDRARKEVLVSHGFRLPSAKDNRPLTFEEFVERIGKTIYVGATPGDYELDKSAGNVVEQIIRPTGLLDPILEVHPILQKGKYKGQVKHFIDEANKEIKKGNRVICTTLTKKTAEDLSEYLDNAGVQARYLHSDIKTIERIEILTDFRKGKFSVLVGVNLLREGLDLPEVTLVAITDADKEGFLRSKTSLVQTIGRAARNKDGRVLLYADNITESLKYAIDETNRRRKLQEAYNKKHKITPKTIKKSINDITEELQKRRAKTAKRILDIDMQILKKKSSSVLKQKQKEMKKAVELLDFETAAILRDEIKYIEENNQ